MIINKIKIHLNETVKLINNFGLKFGILYFFEKITSRNTSKTIGALRVKENKKWVFNNYEVLIKNTTFTINTNLQTNRTIWIYWGQGLDSAPKIIRMCIASIVKESNCKVQILTNNNYPQYVIMPDCIVKKFAEGKMSFTNFSDALRCQVLKEHGGLWLDSTIFLTDFDSEIWKHEFWTVKRTFDNSIGSLSYYRWNTAILKGGSIIFDYLCLLWEKYWEENDHMLDYFLFDYFIDLIYQLNSECKKLIDNVSVNNEQEFELQELLNSPFDQNTFNVIITKGFIHKLQRRSNLIECDECNNVTFYGKLCDDYRTIIKKEIGRLKV